RKLAISQGLCTSTPPWTTRFTFSAASCSSSAAAPFAAPRSSAFTSMWAARTGELGAEAREQVDDPAGQVAGRDRLGELDRGERPLLRCDRDDRVATHER